MSALYVIFWLIGLYASVFCIYAFVGAESIVHFSVKARPWWLLPAQLVSLAAFAGAVLSHPF